MKTVNQICSPKIHDPNFILDRRFAVRGAIALAASAFQPGCTGPISSHSPANPSGSNPQPTPAGPITSASLTVTSTSAGSIGPAFAGLSYEKSMLYKPVFIGSNSNLIALFKRLGPSLLRIGGNTVDQTVWNPTGPGQTSPQVAPPDVDALAAFLKATGWQCLYGINLGGSANGTTSPALAAAEVASVAQTLGSSLLGIEIGNEVDLFGSTCCGGYYAGNWSLSKFLTLWEQYRTAILATTPNASITGPASAGSVSTWTIPFGQSTTKSEITLLTQHYYRGNGQAPTSTAANLVTPDATLISLLSTLKAGGQALGLPYRIAECNSYYNGGASGVSNSYASSLWVLDYMFNCAQATASGVNFHGGGNGTGYTPIADSNGVVVAARPEYYGILLFTLAGQGSLYATQLTAGNLNTTAYAVKTSSGNINIVVINKDSTQSLQLTTLLPQTAASATLLQMTQLSQGATGPNLSATGAVTIQGATVNNDGTFSPAAAFTLSTSGSQFQCYVPALSAVLIQVA